MTLGRGVPISYRSPFISAAKAVSTITRRLEAEGWPRVVDRPADWRRRNSDLENLARAEAEANPELQRFIEGVRRIAPKKPYQNNSREEAAERLCRASFDGAITAIDRNGAEIPRSAFAQPAHTLDLTGLEFREADIDRLWPPGGPADEGPGDDAGSNETSSPTLRPGMAEHSQSEVSAADADSDQSVPPSGIRTTSAEKAELECGRWIKQLIDRPPNKDIAFEQAKAAVKLIGTLSRKGFERAWTANAPAEWKKPGTRKKSPPP